MKKRILKTISAVLAVSLAATMITACEKIAKEPTDLQSYTNVTVPEMPEDEVTKIVRAVLNDPDWNGDFSVIKPAERALIKQILEGKGYHVDITDDGVVYYDYTPTADKEEIEKIVKEVVGKEDWDGEYDSLTDEEKKQVTDELSNRGYDAEFGDNGIVFKNDADRKEEIKSPRYDLLPDKEQLSAVLSDVLGREKFNTWDGNFSSLSPDQRKAMLKQLNDFGFDVGINDKGELYVVHNPKLKTTYDKAATSAAYEGAITTTTAVDPNTFTTAKQETETAPTAERNHLSTFNGDNYRDIAPTKDGGYVALCQFQTATGHFKDTDSTWQKLKFAIVKFDKNGEYKWHHAVGGKSLNVQIGVLLEGITVLKDGSIVAVGYTDARSLGVAKTDNYDGLIVKVSADGTLDYTKRISGTNADFLYSVSACPDGGYVVGGRTKSGDGDFDGLSNEINHAIIAKYSADGTREWTRGFSSGSNASQIEQLVVENNGYIYASCYAAVAIGSKMQGDMASFAGLGNSDSVVFVLSSDGASFKSKAIAGSGIDHITCMSLANDGGVVVGGSFTANQRTDSVFNGQHNYGETDAFLIGLSEDLDVKWIKTYGGIDKEEISGIARVKDGYAVCGWSNSNNNAFDILGSGESDVFVFVTSNNGTETNKYYLKGNGTERTFAIAPSNDKKKFAVVGSTTSANESFMTLSSAPKKDGSPFLAIYDVK